MNILVCIKQVPASSAVEVDPVTGVLKRDGVKTKINPYDLFALEEAFRIKKQLGGKVWVISMGPPQAEDALREALYMGADGACLLSDRRFAGADVLATSRTLAGGVRKLEESAGRFDIILCGKQTTDGDTAQTGPEMAELLGMPHACYVQNIEALDSGVKATAGYGGYLLVQQMKTPCLLTLEKDINTPRLPSYLRRKKMGGDSILRFSLDDFEDRDERRYGLAGSPTQVERIFAPEKKTGRQTLAGEPERVAADAFKLLAERKFI